jgi:2-C-methyl-D-erythritol 4-phosphate cytidylyltransferase
MSNIALIFAGGTGKRMNTTSGLPKQFLELYGKPIIIYTLDKFENDDDVEGIVIACLEAYIPKMWKLCAKFHITKVEAIVPGGSTGQESIYHGLKKVHELHPQDDTVVLVHDGVRPLVDPLTISNSIRVAREKGNAITVTPATETVILDSSDDKVGTILDRHQCQLAKAPQTFFVKDLLECHEKARAEGRNDFIDSANLMRHYGKELYTVEGKTENIKITTPIDYYIFKAIITAKESSNAFGL